MVLVESSFQNTQSGVTHVCIDAFQRTFLNITNFLPSKTPDMERWYKARCMIKQWITTFWCHNFSVAGSETMYTWSKSKRLNVKTWQDKENVGLLPNEIFTLGNVIVAWCTYATSAKWCLEQRDSSWAIAKYLLILRGNMQCLKPCIHVWNCLCTYLPFLSNWCKTHIIHYRMHNFGYGLYILYEYGPELISTWRNGSRHNKLMSITGVVQSSIMSMGRRPDRHA